MSIRTLIEINHDQLRDLSENPDQFFRHLLSARCTPCPHGMKVLAQRHHSDPEFLDAHAFVPLEPTMAMQEAYKGAIREAVSNMPEATKPRRIREPFKMLTRWRAMLAAAPKFV